MRTFSCSSDLIKDQLKTVKHIVVLSHTGNKPISNIHNLIMYDDLIAQFPEEYDFPADLSEWDPAMICYTSATTGDPKGVCIQPSSYFPPYLCCCRHFRGQRG